MQDKDAELGGDYAPAPKQCHKWRPEAVESRLLPTGEGTGGSQSASCKDFEKEECHFLKASNVSCELKSGHFTFMVIALWSC